MAKALLVLVREVDAPGRKTQDALPFDLGDGWRKGCPRDGEEERGGGYRDQAAYGTSHDAQLDSTCGCAMLEISAEPTFVASIWARSDSAMWFDTFSVRPECRALHGVSKDERKTLTTNGSYIEVSSNQAKHFNQPASPR